jgi:hypothetical protein
MPLSIPCHWFGWRNALLSLRGSAPPRRSARHPPSSELIVSHNFGWTPGSPKGSTVSVEVRHPGPGGADLFVRPLQGRANRWAEPPWAAGAKTVPLPTATQFKPLRGSETPPLDLVTPGVQQKIGVKISSSEEGSSLMTPLLIQEGWRTRAGMVIRGGAFFRVLFSLTGAALKDGARSTTTCDALHY